MKAIINLLESKPHIGIGIALAGGSAGWLTALKILTPLLGFVSVCLGVAAGIITLIVKIRELKSK